MRRFLSLSFFLFAFICLNAQQNSVLSSGNWYKIAVSVDGIYKLDNNDLQSLGIETSNLSVNSIKLFGNGGGMLPALNSDFRHNDLQENAIQVVDLNGNGIFNSDDYILFYGQSPHNWKYDSLSNIFNYSEHLFSDLNYFFLKDE